MAWVIVVFMVAVVVLMNIAEYKRTPFCRWCNMCHRGRCMYNPWSGRLFANVNDGHFDYNDPNQ